MLILTSISGLAGDNFFLALSSAERERVLSGAQLVKEKAIENEVWPQVEIVTKVDVAATKMRDMLLDYEHSKNFTPNLLSAKVSSRPNPQTAVIDYTLKIPIIGSEHYSTRSVVEPYSSSGYLLKWTVISGDSISSGGGSVKILPLSAEKCVLSYTNHISPKCETIARVLAGYAKVQTKEFVAFARMTAERLR